MIIYFGLDAIIDDAVATRRGWPTELPWGMPHEIPTLAVVYIGLTAWLWLRWRKLNLSKRDTGDEAADSGEIAKLPELVRKP